MSRSMPPAATASSVRAMWCGVASQVTCSPSAVWLRRMASESAGGGDVLDVEMGAEAVVGSSDVAKQADVALDDAGLGFDGHAAEAEAEGDRARVHAASGGEAGVFGVLGDGEAEAARSEEGGAHDAVFEDGPTVVGEAYGAGFGEGFKVREVLAEAAQGGSGHGEEVDLRLSFGGEHPLQGGDGVVDGECVGHGDDAGEATGGGGGGAGGDGLLVGLAGFAEMDVNVDETGRDDEAGGVEDFGGFHGVEGAGGFDGGDAPLADEEVARGVEICGGIDEVAAGDEYVLHVPPFAPAYNPLPGTFWYKIQVRLVFVLLAGPGEEVISPPPPPNKSERYRNKGLRFGLDWVSIRSGGPPVCARWFASPSILPGAED